MAPPLTILIVDDSAPMRAIIGAIVGAAGHHPAFAESVDLGMDILRRARPDVVLTDYNMPGQTGHDLVLRLRAAGFDNPIFVVSSEREAKLRSVMAEAGANGWLSKPVCAAQLLNLLDGVRRDTFEGRAAVAPQPDQRSDHRLRNPTYSAIHE